LLLSAALLTIRSRAAILPPSPTFYWLPIDALTDILIAEHDIEAL